MADLRFTPDQERAAALRGCDLLVSAAAGSGKTAVLTERVARLVGQGVPLSRILVVTYTNAAAAQMRQRISAALKDAGHGGWGVDDDIAKANICTLHAYCTGFLREFFSQAGVPPLFRVMDENEAAAMRADAMQNALEALFDNPRAGFTDAVDSLEGPERAAAHALRLYEFLRSQPDPDGWLDGAVRAYEHNCADIANSGWARDMADMARAAAGRAKDMLERAADDMAGAQGAERPLEILRSDIGQAKSVMALDTYADMAGYQLRFDRWSAKGFDGAEDVKDVRDRAKAVLTGALELPPPDWAAQNSRATLPALKAVADIARAFEREYEQLKARAERLDFSDLEHKTLAALNAGALAEGRFDHVFVDEYQDANAVQEEIIKRLARGGSLFMVGDVKQSIYGFRLADPGIFARRYHAFAQNDGGALVNLNENFRSPPGLINFVNDVFFAWGQQLGGVDYDAAAALRPHGDEPSPPVRLDITDAARLLDPGPDIDDKVREALADMSAIKAECQRIAACAGDAIKTVAIVENGVARPAMPRDIAVLLRSPKAYARELDAAFKQAGIPCSGELGAGYFGQSEVCAALALIEVVNNLQNDMALIRLMTAPFCGFTPAELLHIRASCGDRDAPFYASLTAYTEVSDDLAERVRDMLNRVSDWRARARRGPVGETVRDILEESRCMEFAGALPFGQTRRQNLLSLCARAAGHDSFGQFARAVMAESESAATAAQAASANAVRVMSIHKSKGLEFPVVIAGGMGREFNLMDTRGAFLMHKDKGLALEYYDPRLNFRQATIAKLAVAEAVKRDLLAEEARLLYVALTRARHALYLTGAVPNLDAWLKNAPRSGQGAVPARFLDFLAPLMRAHPDCRMLWAEQKADAPRGMLSRVDLRVYAEPGGLAPGSVADDSRSVLPAAPEGDGPCPAWIRERMAWTYAPGAAQPPKKTAVTQLIRDEEPPLPPRPLFMQEEGLLSRAERGTAVHTAISLLDKGALRGLDYNRTLAEVHRQLADMISQKALASEQAAAVDIAAIAGFFTGELGRRALAGDALLCEHPFEMLVDSAELPDPDAAAGAEQALVQGVIDLCFHERGEGGGRWVVVDFKSGRAAPPRDTLNAYASQLRLYQKALARAFGTPTQGYIYLLSSGRAIKP